ncbi:MAG: oligosaccharide flippase family protein [Oscillospiraceae bacterium]|nr:oligosaccharide flippase family protein [Oscillospiraceae bacterium]
MKPKSKLAKNLIASIFTYGMGFGISFFLSPYITKMLGVEANGFVNLANQFVGYIALISVALTSMSSRFISICAFQNDYEKANIYFNSVIGASAILAGLLALPLIFLVANLDHVLNIEPALLVDAKILFSIVFINFVFGLLFEVFSIATFITNRLYLSSLRSIEGNLVRCALLISAYVFLEAKMYYVSIGAMVSNLYLYAWNIYYTRKFMPQMQIRPRFFKLNAIKELVKAGSWNIVIQLNNILNTGLDLLLSNWLLGEKMMGVLAVAKTIPTSVTTMLNSVSGVFLPEMTELYAKDDMSGLKKAIERSIKVLAMLFNIPIVFLIAYGTDFYKLWQPTLEANVLQILCLLTLCTMLVSGSTAAVFGVFTITNKLRFHSFTSLAFGVANVILVVLGIYIAPKEYGVYIVAGISSLLIIVRNYCLTFPYAAKCIQQKWYAFHVPSLRTIMGAVLASLICLCVRALYVPHNWYMLIFSGVIAVISSVIVSVFVVLQKSDREYVAHMIRSKLHKS